MVFLEWAIFTPFIAFAGSFSGLPYVKYRRRLTKSELLLRREDIDKATSPNLSRAMQHDATDFRSSRRQWRADHPRPKVSHAMLSGTHICNPYSVFDTNSYTLESTAMVEDITKKFQSTWSATMDIGEPPHALAHYDTPPLFPTTSRKRLTILPPIAEIEGQEHVMGLSSPCTIMD